MSQVAINWCISKGTVPIVGARNVEQATDICNTLKWSLTSEEVILLETISSEFRVGLSNPRQSNDKLKSPNIKTSSVSSIFPKQNYNNPINLKRNIEKTISCNVNDDDYVGDVEFDKIEASEEKAVDID